MIITLLSDFGSLYQAAVKGVILGIAPEANIVDIAHDIPPQDVRAGAFALYSVARYFPSGTVHIGVVDPGVGTGRRPIAIKAGLEQAQYFVGPDNGLLIPAARSIGGFKVYEISNKELLKEVSPTFHGRDIFAPVGAHLARGLAIEAVGACIQDYCDLDFGVPKRFNKVIKGLIIHIDSFGNIISNIPAFMVGISYGSRLMVFSRWVSFVETYGLAAKGEPLALVGSHGFLEIGINQGNAAEVFGAKIGDVLEIVMG